jgi:hypothetical protein
LRIDLIGTSGNHNVGPLKRSQRLAKQSSRQQVSITEWFSGIEQNYLQVAMNPTMLKSIVQQEDLHVQLLDRNLRDRNAIRRLKVWHIWEAEFQFFGLVVNPVGASSVTTRKDGYTDLPIPKPLS